MGRLARKRRRDVGVGLVLPRLWGRGLVAPPHRLGAGQAKVELSAPSFRCYTFASHGFGYFTETETHANGTQEVRMGYVHQDGRTAMAAYACDRGSCRETSWNGVPFPFGH